MVLIPEPLSARTADDRAERNADKIWASFEIRVDREKAGSDASLPSTDEQDFISNSRRF